MSDHRVRCLYRSKIGFLEYTDGEYARVSLFKGVGFENLTARYYSAIVNFEELVFASPLAKNRKSKTKTEVLNEIMYLGSNK